MTQANLNDSTDLDDLLAEAEAYSNEFNVVDDSRTVCAPAPVSQEQVLPARAVPTAPRGRPVFTDPTDPEQIHAIANRCKAHYIPCQGQWVHITKKEAKAFAKALKLQGNPVVAQISRNGSTLYFG